MHENFMKKSHRKNIVQLIIKGYKWHCRKMEFYILRALVKCHLFYVYIIWYLNYSILVYRQRLLILLTVVKIQMLTELKSYYDLLHIYIHIYMCVLSMCIHKYSLANNVKPSTFECQVDRVVRRFDVNYRLTESRIPSKIGFWACEWGVIFMTSAAREHPSQLWADSYTGILGCRLSVCRT